MTARKISSIAMFTAMATILNIFTISTGVKYFVISFTYLPCFFAGMFLGPFAGFIVGFVGDILGCLIHPLGPWIPFISISAGFLGMIPGFVFKFIKSSPNKKYEKIDDYFKTILSFFLILIICTAGINTFGLFLMFSKGKTFWAYLAVRLPFQFIVMSINIFVAIAILKPMKAMQRKFLLKC